MNHLQQRLWESVDTLIGPGSLQDRLRYAAQRLGGAQGPIFPDDENLRTSFDDVKNRLATGREVDLPDDEAKKIAQIILALFLRATPLATEPVDATDVLEE